MGSWVRGLAAVGGIVLLTVAGGALRLAGLGHHLPHFVESDWQQVDQASHLRGRLMGTRPDPPSLHPHYPLLLPAVAAVLPELAPGPWRLSAPRLDDHLAAAAERVLRMRLVVALASLLAVPATWLVARRFLSAGPALCAAALVATALLPLCFSQQARPHGGFLGVSGLALAVVLRQRRRGTAGADLAAGLAVGAAVATLHFGFFLVPPLVVAHVLAPARRRVRGSLVLALLLVAGAAWVAYPTLGGGFDPPKAGPDGGFGGAGHPSLRGSFHGRGFRFVLEQLLSWDPVLLAGASVGLVLALLALVRRPPRGERRADLLVVLSFWLPFGLALGLFDRTLARFLLPLYPGLAVLAAYPLHAFGERARRPGAGRTARWLPVGAAVALLGPPAVVAAQWVRLHVVPDTPTRAARWLEEHADRERDVVATSPHLALPLLPRPEPPTPVPLWAMSPWERHAWARGAARDERVPRWHLVSLWVSAGGAPEGRALFDLETLSAALARVAPAWTVLALRPPAVRDRTRDAVLAAGGVQVARFAPSDRPGAPPLQAFELGRPAVLHVLRSRCLGPPIEVWRMPGRER